jgi:hypothetical protein
VLSPKSLTGVFTIVSLSDKKGGKKISIPLILIPFIKSSDNHFFKFFFAITNDWMARTGGSMLAFRSKQGWWGGGGEPRLP